MSYTKDMRSVNGSLAPRSLSPGSPTGAAFIIDGTHLQGQAKMSQQVRENGSLAVLPQPVRLVPPQLLPHTSVVETSSPHYIKGSFLLIASHLSVLDGTWFSHN